MQGSANVCYAKLVVYALARILRTRLDMQGHAAMPAWCRRWWAALRGSTGCPPLPVRGCQASRMHRLPMLWTDTLFEPTWFQILSTRQDCTSLPCQEFVVNNLVQVGSKHNFDQTTSCKLAQQKRFHPASLYIIVIIITIVIQTSAILPGQILFEHKTQASYTWNQTVLTRQAWLNKRQAI